MTAAQIIDNLRKVDIRLTPDGDKIKVNGPDAALTDDVLDLIFRSKPQLLAALTSKCVEDGRYLRCSDGHVYARIADGTLVLVRHPTRRMREPGTIEVPP